MLDHRTERQRLGLSLNSGQESSGSARIELEIENSQGVYFRVCSIPGARAFE